MLVCGLVVLGLLLSASSALAGGGGGSAGNSQYVDPLSAQPHHKSKGTSAGTSTSTTTSTTSSSSTLSQSAPSSVGTSTASTSSQHSASGRTLPFTGLNLWACVGLGLGLLGGGLALRRALARAY